MLKLGSVRLELFRTDSAKTEHQKGGEQGIGSKLLVFEVPRLEPAIEALRADGIEPDPIIDMGSSSRAVGSSSFVIVKALLSS
jgi:hypothetical protein